MARIQARWLAMAASALLAAGAPAQAPPAVPADPSRGVDVSAEAPDPTQALRAEALTLFGRLDDDRASVSVSYTHLTLPTSDLV